LATDYPMVIPVGRYVRYYTAAADVIHSWTVPAFGVKTDAVPGRLNEGWFLVTEPGVYYGQCSELCGIDHAYMPIEVRVVSQAQYDRWAELMLAGDVDAAADSVRLIASNTSAEPSTQLAANP
jgi:cytochrome c oxidase subunit 2